MVPCREYYIFVPSPFSSTGFVRYHCMYVHTFISHNILFLLQHLTINMLVWGWQSRGDFFFLWCGFGMWDVFYCVTFWNLSFLYDQLGPSLCFYSPQVWITIFPSSCIAAETKHISYALSIKPSLFQLCSSICNISILIQCKLFYFILFYLIYLFF